MGNNNQRLILKSSRGWILLCTFWKRNWCHSGLVWRLWVNAVSTYILMNVHILTEWGCPSLQRHTFLGPKPLKPCRGHKFSHQPLSQNNSPSRTCIVQVKTDTTLIPHLIGPIQKQNPKQTKNVIWGIFIANMDVSNTLQLIWLIKSTNHVIHLINICHSIDSAK